MPGRVPVGTSAALAAADLTAALDELLDTRNAMTRTLLGAGSSPADD
ncbi:hypothetical protein [Modestobacter sp. I12A-02662]